jgi:hypothetical protein
MKHWSKELMVFVRNAQTRELRSRKKLQLSVGSKLCTSLYVQRILMLSSKNLPYNQLWNKYACA